MSGTARSRLRSKPWAGLPPWCSRHHCQDLGYLLWAYQLAGFLGSPFELQRYGREPEETLEVYDVQRMIRGCLNLEKT